MFTESFIGGSTFKTVGFKPMGGAIGSKLSPCLAMTSNSNQRSSFYGTEWSGNSV
jgi:hypothetical protein